MKYAIVILDGAADRPLDELAGRTPLAAANKPAIDAIATGGRLGMVRTVPKGMAPGSDVAILSVLGYDPTQCYTGRAPLEAAARGLKVSPDEWIFRCNFVTIAEGIMADHSAGHISTEEATALIAELNDKLGDDGVTFFHGVGYRHLMTLGGKIRVTTTPPHDILGKPIKSHLPRGKGADRLVTLIERSQAVLADHEINMVRRDLDENVASNIWLWGQGKMPRLQGFTARFGVSAAVITAVDLVRGIAVLTGMDIIEVDGATAYIDTNYAGKGQAAVAALDDHDLVIVHVEAPDECGHNAQPKLKTKAIEDIDRHIVAPLLQRLQADKDWRILVCPDHPTPCEVRTHTTDPVPFAITGDGVQHVVSEPFTEDAAAESDLHIEFGHELMEYFLKVGEEARPQADSRPGHPA